MRLIQHGPRGSHIMLVGEAPGEREIEAGRPFTGGAGQLLEHSLSRAGISMSQCFQTNVCHVPPPGKKVENFYKKENQQHLLAGMLQLRNDITDIQPSIVVPLGALALQVVTGKKGIDKWRGSILESALVQGQKCVATYNPAYALKIYEAKAIMEIDFQRVKDESTTKLIQLPERQHILNPDDATRATIRSEMLGAEYLAVDIECWLDAGGTWRLACVGFSDRPDRSLVIPADSPARMLDIRLLCESKGPKRIFQNGQFDVSVLKENGIIVQDYAWDTMYGHHALFAEAAGGEEETSKLAGKKKTSVFKKGLAFQTSIYTREPFYKDDGKLWTKSGDINMFYLYNGKDAAVTREIQQVQEVELHTFGTRCMLDHEMSMVPALMWATERGCRIDMTERERLKQMFMQELENFQRFLDIGAGRPVNVKSTPDMKWLLYDKLKMPEKYKQRKRSDGTYDSTVTADKDAINELAGKYPNPLLQSILKIRERRDYLDRYINIPLGKDGRMRCLFDPSGTRSYRLSSRASLDGSGTNLQTIPARKAVGEAIKRMFIADEGKVFIYPDYKQAEAWLVAYLSRCEGLIELLNDPSRDIHYENASRIFNKPVSQITKEERYLAKRVVHASNYGMGGRRLVELIAEDAETTGIRIGIKEADDLIRKYFLIYPEIRNVFWRDVETNVRHSRILTTPFGAKRAFFGRMDDKLLREAYSYIPQSTVGVLGGKAVARIYNEVQLGRPELGVEFLLNVHDSTLNQANESMVKPAAVAILEAMRIPITVFGRTFTIPTDCQIGRNWGSRGKKDADGNYPNPQGMRQIDEDWEGLNIAAA